MFLVLYITFMILEFKYLSNTTKLDNKYYFYLIIKFILFLITWLLFKYLNLYLLV